MIPSTVEPDVLNELSATTGSSLISIFIPTHARGRDVSQDRIRLKNQLAAADRTLEELGRKPRERRERLARGHELLDDREFWEHQSSGLAIYLSEEGELTALSLDDSVDPAAEVMPVFKVRPLLSTLDQPVFGLLALTRARVELYRVDRQGIRQLDVDLPESMEDVNWFVDRESQRQQHPDRAGSSRNRHGHEPSAQRDEDLDRFLREVSSALPPGDGDHPLVVLGDDDLVARFANISDREVVSPASSGLSTDFNETQVHSLAIPVLEELAASRQEKIAEDARSALGTGQAATDLTSAVPEAAAGRIGRLVIDPEASGVWGRFDSTDHTIEVHDERRPADVDLVDRLVTLSLETGAEVLPIHADVIANDFIAIRRF